MGCASSFNRSLHLNERVLKRNELASKFHSRETRILQAEEVDVLLEDEVDLIENDWKDWPDDYQILEENGAWIQGMTSGGSRNDLEKFSTNPQFSLNVGPPEIVEESLRVDPYFTYLHDMVDEEKKIRLTVSLTQDTSTLLHVAFFIYKIESWSGSRLGAEYFLIVQPEGDTGPYVNWRQLKHEYSLFPGAYILVAAAFDPKAEGKFTISVRGPKPFTLSKISQENDLLF